MTNQATVRSLSITDEEIRFFSEGDCWMLAEALWVSTGWTLVAVAACEEEPVENPSPEVDWIHLAVRTPDGRIVDIRGAHVDVDEYLQQWIGVVEMSYCEPMMYIYEVHDRPTYNHLVRDQSPMYGVTSERVNDIVRELVHVVEHGDSENYAVLQLA
jgi:hypothetical protein